MKNTIIKMLKREEVHRTFLGALEKKIPDKTKLVEMLMETLFMEKGAIYRRLRGDVPFSFYEAVDIAEKLDMSLSSFIHADCARVNRFELTFVDYTKMDEADYKQWEDYVSFVGSAKNDAKSEIAESSNILPVCVYAGFDFIAKYFLFKYQYLLHGLDSRTSYCDLVVPERLHRIFRTYFEKSKNIANTTYILDYMTFQYLATDIRFFYDIHLISNDDILQIKEDLLALLNYIEDISLIGYYEETGNPVSIYISDVNLDADYICMHINDAYASLVRTFILNSVESDGRSSFKKIYDWIQSQKKSSTSITKTGTAYRTDFFEKQRNIISDL